ncbi:hypothetical protein TREMEDRAFT_15595, partial [Tremella mesenterica DSM 1558]|uniref:uncharacterized protein n=1 Tax=Tremella mesenterica (strain ATCC 24925 / CBS 8224 / DSM 1558 / NBRC 9311 / NRRL Y-6157 / RJB 2259-6 / UBC 559-6) TaxID=578456 RepID=UPI0003F49B65
TSDPLSAIHAEISNLQSTLFKLLGSSHPSLDTIAKYYFRTEGKHLRPLLVLLISQATNGLGGSGWEHARIEAGRRGMDDALTSRGGVLNDWNPEIMGPESTTTFSEPFLSHKSSSSSSFINPHSSLKLETSQSSSENHWLENDTTILPTQRRLASITEMIHVASLLHDDVVDTSPLRRGQPSAPSAFGNKLSILAGDFLLGRASVALARLGSSEVVELLSTVIANLVEGEVLQMKATSSPESIPSKKGFEEYMRKTYLKTASLMAKSARAAVVLGGCGEEGSDWVKDVAYAYGRNLGIAFQLIDDTLDFIPSPTLGKPSLGADLRLGLATAPALYAWENSPSLGPLIARRFSQEGDVDMARELVNRSDALERTRELARNFANEAKRGMEKLPESEAREALMELCEKVVERVK